VNLTASHLLPALVLSFGALTFASDARAAIPTKHGQLFDGCPLCNAGKIGADGTPLDPLSPRDFSAEALTKPDGLVQRPTRASAGGGSLTLTKAESLPEVKQRADGFWDVSFANLASFSFEAPVPDAPGTPEAAAKIPETIRALHGKRIRIAGYMLPTKLEAGLVREFLVLRSSMLCCYGIVPSPTEWIVVKMAGKGVAPAMDVPLNFYGTLQVGEIYEEKTFVGLYAMTAEKISPD
jgi:hypothetical protein